jgi:DNA modification methylase
MLTKENIAELKKNKLTGLTDLIKKQNDSQSIIFLLENLGHLPDGFDGIWLLDFLKHQNSKVRFWSAKNIGKLQNFDFFQTISEAIKFEKDTIVRRELVSAIGRMKNPKTKDFLLSILHDSDPKIVIQAIRGLLVFKEDINVQKKLKELINHENEMIKTAIDKEFFQKEDETTSKLPHPETYDFLKNVVVNGDVRDVLKLVPDESVHLTFTSPPYYNARDYSIYPSYQAYLDFLAEVFKETHRISKEGRFLIVNTSPIIIPRISRAHSSKRYPIPFDLHSILVKNGWEFIDDIVWLKPEASVKNRVGGFQQHRKPLAYKPNAVTEMLMVYRKETTKLLDWNMKQYSSEIVNKSKVLDEFETTNVWKIDPTFDKVHSAVFPFELCKKVIQYYSYVGDLVFDPFAGSGTLGRTAKSLNRLFFLTEKDKEYFEYMKSKASNKNLSIFKERKTRFLSLEQFREVINDINRSSY